MWGVLGSSVARVPGCPGNPEDPRTRGPEPALLWLLVALYALQQLFTAAFDFDSNPRRALPVVCAFAIAWCWIVDRDFDKKWWRVTFVALFAVVALLAFADTLLDTPTVAGLYTGETVRAEPKSMLEIQANRIVLGGAPPAGFKTVLISFPRASIANLTVVSALAQLYIGFFAAAFFWILAKARLLPHYAPFAFAGVWLVSGVRFLW